MRFHLSKKEKLILLIIFLIAVIIWVSVFFLIIQPKKKELELQENQLRTEQQTLTSIQNQLTNMKNVTFDSSVQLQKSVPVKPLLEELVLDIEKAEVVADGHVKDMTFGEGEAVELEKDDEKSNENEQSNGEQVEDNNRGGTEKDENVNEDKENEQNQNEQNQNESQKKKKETIPLPDGVKKIAIKLEVETETYKSLEKFIETIENSERIIVVENIDFTGPKEITSEDGDQEPLDFTLTISAFYMPSLTDLIDQLPQIDAPAPSNKVNPFIQFSDVKNENN